MEPHSRDSLVTARVLFRQLRWNRYRDFARRRPLGASREGYLERWVLRVFRIIAQRRYEYTLHAELSSPQNRLVDARAGLSLGISCTVERVVA